MTATVTALAPTKLLRFALTLDGVATCATGVLMLPLAEVLASALGMPAGLLLGMGAFFVLYGIGVLFVATRRAPARAAVLTVIAINLLSVVDSVATVTAGWFDLTTLGAVIVVALAVVVAAAAGLQAYAYRDARS